MSGPTRQLPAGMVCRLPTNENAHLNLSLLISAMVRNPPCARSRTLSSTRPASLHRSRPSAMPHIVGDPSVSCAPPEPHPIHLADHLRGLAAARAALSTTFFYLCQHRAWSAWRHQSRLSNMLKFWSGSPAEGSESLLMSNYMIHTGSGAAPTSLSASPKITSGTVGGGGTLRVRMFIRKVLSPLR